MNQRKPKNVNELINMAAEALRNADDEQLEFLKKATEDWLVDSDAAQAHSNLLNAMLEAVEELGDARDA